MDKEPNQEVFRRLLCPSFGDLVQGHCHLCWSHVLLFPFFVGFLLTRFVAFCGMSCYLALRRDVVQKRGGFPCGDLSSFSLFPLPFEGCFGSLGRSSAVVFFWLTLRRLLPIQLVTLGHLDALVTNRYYFLVMRQSFRHLCRFRPSCCILCYGRCPSLLLGHFGRPC